MSHQPPFRVDVPPPPFNNNISHLMQSRTDPNIIVFNNVDADRANYDRMMLDRYSNYVSAPQHPPNSNFFSANPSISFSLPAPLTRFPPPQLPLPFTPPSMTLQIHHMGNFNNNMSASGHYSKSRNNFKRKKGNDAHKKLQKKKKKKKASLQEVPHRRDWTLEEAKRALDIEKNCNKKSKRQGLIIKFPDVELNRDIVMNFNAAIESVHFQQPSTPRYCFVSLKESTHPEKVINQLNQIPFGTGYLSADFKKDKEDEQNIGPSDIDPLTLYVGNLAQEVTKDDMMKKYPKQKKIEIGYAKKMKHTRYAFVSFHTADNAIEAFQNTHSEQMYAKSLIVRFRRLQGTVGIPGQTTQQQIHQPTESESVIVISDSCNNAVNDGHENDKEHNPWDIDISQWENSAYQEAECKRSDTHTSEDDDDDEEIEFIPLLSSMPYRTNFMPEMSLEMAMAFHQPIIDLLKEEEVYEDNRDEDCICLIEDEDNATGQSSNHKSPRNANQSPPSRPAEVKTVVSKIKQEAKSSNTSYEHLRFLTRLIQAGLLPHPLNKKRQNIKKENDGIPCSSNNVQDREENKSEETSNKNVIEKKTY